MVLAGAAGVGKTRLALEGLSLSRRHGRWTSWIVATGSARSVPLGAFAEFAAGFGPDPVRRVPEVINALIGDSPAMSTVVGVDDAHLLDDLSALVIYQLVHRKLATVVVTVRTAATVPDAIRSLWKDEGLPRIDVQPLSAEEIAVLVASALGGEVESSSAERLWRYTQGNVLYLRQLIADECASGRISKRSDLWVWDGHPDVSPTLIELIESNTGRHEDAVIAVLNVLAVVDPIELSVLRSLVPSAAIDVAEDRGLILVDADPAMVRMAHPMFGEARRGRAGAGKLRALRGEVAAAIGELCAPSLQRTVRRAVLMLDSDRTPDPALLLEAVDAAMALLDPRLAIRFAQNAIRYGGGRQAQLAYGVALAAIAVADEAERVLAELASTATDPAELAMTAMVRAASLTWNCGRPAAALQVLDAAESACGQVGLSNSLLAIRISCYAAAGRPWAAIGLSDQVATGETTGIDAEFLAWGQVTALGEAGRLNGVNAAAARGYHIATTAAETAHLRFGLGVLHVHALYLGGDLREGRAIARDLRRQSQDVDVSLSVTAMLAGQAALYNADLAAAQRWLRESLATGAENLDGGMGDMVAMWLARALAMSGDREAAQQVIGRIGFLDGHQPMWDVERSMTVAWVHAVSGVLSKAISVARCAARTLGAQGRWACEVIALQTATQFGDRATAGRLAELTSIVQGPRVIAAAAHARALADADPAALLAAARSYEDFGEVIAAADATAQASIALREHGRCGSSISAAAAARRLADSCGADTPAQRAVTAPTPLTDRQREIIALAATGLTNRQIAERLVMSVRTVEGHLFRASQRAGVSTREGLIALLEGRLTEASASVG